MPANPQRFVTLSLLDYSREKSNFSVLINEITALNIVNVFADVATLRSATDAVTLGTLIQSSVNAESLKLSGSAPTDANAQRERKALVKYHDNTTFSNYRLEIPTAKFESGGTSWLLPGTDLVDLTVTEWAAWVAAFQDMAVSPDGNGVTVDEIVAVGRSI